MTSSVPEDWTTANQRYLITAIREVREELELYHKRKGRKDRGEKHITVGTADQGKETAGVARPGAPPALETLTSVFRLTSFEKKILLMCTGAELDSSFASLVAALQGDPGSFLPTFSSAMTIFPDAHWSALSPGAPLRYWQLVEAGSGRSLTRSPLRIDERILHYLTGVSHPDERLTGVIERVSGSGGLVASHREQAGRLLEMLRKSSAEAVFPVIMIQGEDTGDMLDIVSGACSLPGLDLWFMTSGSVPGNVRERAELVRLWNREAALGTGALFIDCSEADTGDLSQLQAITTFCERLTGVLFIGYRSWKPALRRPVFNTDVQKPRASEQLDLWNSLLDAAPVRLNGEPGKIVSQFNLSARTIRAIGLEMNRDLSGREPREVTAEDLTSRLWKACCSQSRPRLDELAQRINPAARWADLVLNDFQVRTLKEIARHARQRAKVYHEWGFASTSSRGLGISSLFTGETGTGKTMASEVLANELNLDLYKIDLSQVINKYVGETEKNLKKIFDAAEDGGAILLFDEADALFGKRSEVKDSHDRYANIEVSYLLQRMEAYRGLAILTTNLKTVLDKAFLRRIRFVVQFPFPDARQRAEIWKHIFPAGTPKENLDWEKLSRMNLAGGSIRNIALNAAFIAADEGVPVSMNHLSQAAGSEYAKLEKQFSLGEMIT